LERKIDSTFKQDFDVTSSILSTKQVKAFQ